MGDTRTDSGQFYPGGRVIARRDVAPPQIVVQWSDVQGKPQIAPLPERFRDGDVKTKINEIASKFTTVIVAAFIGWSACADVTVQKKRKDEIYNDELVVVDVTGGGGGGGVNTNAVIDIANATIATNPVVEAKLDGPTVAPTNIAEYAGKAADAKLTGIALTNRYTKAETEAKLDLKPDRSELDAYVPYLGATKEVKLGSQNLSARSVFASRGLSIYDSTDSIDIFTHSIIVGSLDNHIYWPWADIGTARNKFALLSDIPEPYVPSATDPTFSNAVLSVGINTNLVASIGELNDFIHGYGELGATSVGGLILALLGAAALLRKKTSLLKSDGTAEDDFATDLLGKPVANVKANTVSLAAAYSETAIYAVGDAVTHDGKLYKCNTAITTAEAWTLAHWTETTVANLWNDADTTSYGGQN